MSVFCYVDNKVNTNACNICLYFHGLWCFGMILLENTYMALFFDQSFSVVLNLVFDCWVEHPFAHAHDGSYQFVWFITNQPPSLAYIIKRRVML